MNPSIPKQKILIVDDEQLNTKLLAAKIHSDDYDILLADSGEACLTLLGDHTPDLILLDIMMPGMDGFEVCQQIRSDPALNDIPILFITALTDADHKRRGFEMGAVDYITKPFDDREVKARIKTHLALKAARDALHDQNRVLERQVKKRTHDLERANRHLQQEIEAKTDACDALQISEAHNQAIIAALPDLVLQIDATGTVRNRRGAGDLLPIEGDRLIGKSLTAILPPEIASDALAHIQQTLQDTGKGIFEFEIVLEETPRHFESRLVKIDRTNILAITRDVTEQKKSERALREREKSLQQENLRLKAAMKDRHRFGHIIGKSRPMQMVYDLIMEAAGHDTSVVIYGESGTGKELVADAIHTMSERQNGPFVPVNCGAIPENLIESEFFGYKKGAFTGATEDKPGYLDSADKGTLFLDEIGEISLNLQVKLLRALEGNGFTPVGGQRRRQSDVRFVGATNKELMLLVNQGSMREDFFYRIHIITIHLPPLRDRKEDIPLLVDHFYRQYAPAENAPPPIAGQVLDSLIDYHWPGNVRELSNTIQRYTTLKKIDLMGTAISAPSSPTMPPSAIPSGYAGQDYKQALQNFEKQFIQHALEQHRWHREKAAESLGIPRRTFFRKLKALGLSRA